MAKVRCTGFGDPKHAFSQLWPYRARLIDMQDKCRTFHAKFLILHAAQRALDAAAHYFPREPEVHALRSEHSRDGGAPDSIRGGRDGY